MSNPGLQVGDLSQFQKHLNQVQPTVEESTIWNSNPIFKYLNTVYLNIDEKRRSLDLVNPGTIENLTREVTRDVFPTMYQFTGMRAELNKTFAMNPIFQTSHTFATGSEHLPKYAFACAYINDNFFAQGNIDNSFGVNGRVNYSWTPKSISKLTLQMSPGEQQPSMYQLEHDYQGLDNSLNLKVLNPTLGDNNVFLGVGVVSILQSVTKNLAIGVESIYSKSDASQPADSGMSYYSKFTSTDKSWNMTGQLQSNGGLSATFYRKLSPNVELGLESALKMAIQPVNHPVTGEPIGQMPVLEGLTTIGCKYEYRSSNFRGTVDSEGKVNVFAERKILPTLGVVFSGEINQFKGESNLGFGLQFETAGSQEIMMAQQGLDVNGNPLQ
ncbi:hypothetical protein HANVADRAFT_52136 [Hanseniaspora valbyensis NRRL Y-1626]|uniref:Mitochondrial import receptor subunit TOM40 n=1 Tax=Hanseniaspora valbyensis NRRL Y-1626 TaxID=766949 RepID=A0A1B7TG23_9ASCO|nr:hypothetical protein HANVADRAFT_52136 [Hanseniaspora valbyensis NRRL Y-1626]